MGALAGCKMPLDVDFKLGPEDDEEWGSLKLPAETHVQVEDHPFSGEGKWVQPMRDCLMANLKKADEGDEEIFFPQTFPGPEALLFDSIPEYCRYMKYTLKENNPPNPDCGACGNHSHDNVMCFYSFPTVMVMSATDPQKTFPEDKKIFWETEVFCIKCRKFTRREFRDSRCEKWVGAFPGTPNPDRNGPAHTRPSCLNRPLCMIDCWGEAPMTLFMPNRAKPTNPPSMMMMDLPDEDGNWTMYNQTKAPKSEYFPNPGDPDYKPYKDRHEGNRWGTDADGEPGWGYKARQMDKITQEFLDLHNQQFHRKKLEKSYGMTRVNKYGTKLPRGENGLYESDDWIGFAEDERPNEEGLFPFQQKQAEEKAAKEAEAKAGGNTFTDVSDEK